MIFMKETLKIKECPVCDSPRIKKVRKNWTGESHGAKFHVSNLDYFECPDCHEKIYGPHALRRIQEKSPAFKSRLKKKAA